MGYDLQAASEIGTWMMSILVLDAVGICAVLLSLGVALVARIRGKSACMIRGFPVIVMLGAALPSIIGGTGFFVESSAGSEAAAVAALRLGGISTVLLGIVAVLALIIVPWNDKTR